MYSPFPPFWVTVTSLPNHPQGKKPKRDRDTDSRNSHLHYIGWSFFLKIYIYLYRYTFKRLFPCSAWHNMLIQIWDILMLTFFFLITLPNYTTLHSSFTRMIPGSTLTKAMSTHTSFHEGLHLCWGFLTLVINALYSLTIPTLHHQPRVLYFPQSHHFLAL